tara:strand:+ start:3178 stop:4503 length:1326 start_codon:yes stop_codon:yes gene_type:complete
MNNKENQLEKSEEFMQDIVDLRFLYKFFIRNIKFITSVSLVFFLISFLYSFTVKRIWEGQFQIVLNDEEDIKNPFEINYDSFLASSSNTLKTQVGILESPSILMPIFDYVIERKDNKNYKKNFVFSKWKKQNLKVNLEKGTSILNISYKDTDKELILPVLKKMTDTYQEYSGREKKRNLELGVKYLTNQIEIFKDKSANSIRRAQEFAMEEDLQMGGASLVKISPPQDEATFNNKQPLFSITNTSIESERIKAANEIRNLKEQLINIEAIKDDNKSLEYLARTIPALNEEGLLDFLKDIEEQLLNTKLKYKDNDKRVKDLTQKRELYINFLRQRAIGTLKAQILATQAYMKSAIRPEGVILEYKKLMREAERDEFTLVSLEDQLRKVELEQKKLEDPWELITKPTLLKEPVNTPRLLVGIYGLLAGIIFGSGISFYKEKNK